MEEAPFLVAMDRVVGGVEIENDLLGRALVRLQEQVDEQSFDRCAVVGDLVIARRLGPAQLKPVQRRLAGQRRAIRARAASLPASTAMAGSWRRWSWSLRSS